MLVTTVVGYVFWWGTANAVLFNLHTTLGPFYHYAMLAPVAVLAARAVTEVHSRRTQVAIGAFALLWMVPASVAAFVNARDNGRARPDTLIDAASDTKALIIDDAARPYVPVANSPDLDDVRLIAADVPGRNLELVTRYPDRALSRVESLRPIGEPFGPFTRKRVDVAVVSARQIDLNVVTNPPTGREASLYLRVGSRTAVERGAATHIWSLRPDMVGEGTTVIAVGYSFGNDERTECSYEARGTADGHIELLTPCSGSSRYLFPNGATATVPEDVTGRVTATVIPR
jgi:hypothetical protein